MKTAARGAKPQIREVKRKGQRDLSDPAGNLHPQGCDALILGGNWSRVASYTTACSFTPGELKPPVPLGVKTRSEVR